MTFDSWCSASRCLESLQVSFLRSPYKGITESDEVFQDLFSCRVYTVSERKSLCMKSETYRGTVQGSCFSLLVLLQQKTKQSYNMMVGTSPNNAFVFLHHILEIRSHTVKRLTHVIILSMYLI